VAEGVESIEQRELLRARGCDEMQGFVFSAAVDGEDAQRFLEPVRMLRRTM
jgi:EAL domain-containing protein (putative c-di-GMP-specific phosphodiesterase class I)